MPDNTTPTEKRSGRKSRIIVGKTALRALAYLKTFGPTPMSHGVRYAQISGGLILLMSSTNHHLRTTGMVEWAGGNYGRWHVRITDYGLRCLARGWHDSDHPRVPLHSSYGPREAA